MSQNSDNMQPKLSSSGEVFATYSLRSKDSKSDKIGMEPGTSYEVFRNNTTAIEVIVKEMPRYKKSTATNVQEMDVKRFQRIVDNLKIEVDQTNWKLMATRNGFKSLVVELKKQLEAANQRELDQHTKNLALELENEKLRTALNSKTNLLTKMKKELISMKRILKFVIKGMTSVPQNPENYSLSSDPEYDDFEKDLKKEAQVKFPKMCGEGGVTFDSTMSKDLNSFEKQFH